MFAEVRSATRGLLRWRGGLAVALATLTIGIGTATSLCALVRVLLADFPGVPELDRVARIYAASPRIGVDRAPVAFNEFQSTLAAASSFGAVAAYAAADATVGSGPDARPVIAGYVSPAFFTAFGVPPVAGRTFSSADTAGAHPVVMVGEALWRTRFPDGDLANAHLLVDGIDRAVVGVMPRAFSYPFIGVRADVWVPIGSAGGGTPAIVTVFARLRPGVTWSRAGADLDSLARAHAPWTWHAISLATEARSRAVGAYGYTLAPALLILLIACLNVACLLLARGLERDRELSVRRALGATRRQVVKLLLIEHAVLATISGVLGAGLAILALRAMASAAASVDETMAARISADLSLLPVALAVSGVACLVFGLAPALRVSRRDVLPPLNGRVLINANLHGYGARDLIVFAEVASAAGLMVWVAMLFTLFGQLRAIHFTFPAQQIVAMRVPASQAGAITGRIENLPGVVRVAISSGMLGGGEHVRVETPDGRAAVLGKVPVGPGFLETLGVPVLRGRAFGAGEADARSGAIVLSETAAARLAPNGDALGMRLRTNVPNVPELIVIGICADAVDHGAIARAGLVPAEVYVPLEGSSPERVILARVMGDAHASLRAIGDAARVPAGMRPPRPVVLTDEFTGRDRDGSLLLVKLLGGFAVLTLVLAASGVFAVVNQSVAQRTREFGIRIAIGAAPRRVLGMVLVREGKLIGLGLAVGTVFTIALTRALFAELTSLSALLPGRSIAALIVATAVASLAVTLATVRIVRLEPAVVLRRS